MNRMYLIITLLFGVLVLVAGCGPSPADLTATSDAVASAAVTNTVRPTRTHTPLPPTPTRTPEPTSTPTPTPTAVFELPPLVSEYLADARALRIHRFESLSEQDWQYDPQQVKWIDDSVQLNGEKFWRTRLTRQSALGSGEGILVSFKYSPDSEFEFFLDRGKWPTKDYRSFGLYNGRMAQTTGWNKGERMKEEPLYATTSLKPDVWYTLLIAVGDDARHLLLVWQQDDPAKFLRYRAQFNWEWVGLDDWAFNASVNEGSLLIDDFCELAFSKIQ